MEQRRDGENKREAFKGKNWATHLYKLASIRGMDELRFLYKTKVLKAS